MSVLKTLTEGIVHRDVSKEGAALLEKWEATGLLEGLNDERAKNGMAVLLENQAKELLREASSMSAGDVEGFASVAFPIVRRVFGGLIANDLVSVQPMSLPSGLIFFMDFVHADSRGGMTAGDSVYGGNVVGRSLINGVDLDEDLTKDGAGGFYDLGTGYSSPTGSVASANETGLGIRTVHLGADGKLVSALTEAEKKLIRFDADVLANPTYTVQVFDCDFDDLTNLNEDALSAIELQTNGAGTQILIFDDDANGADDFETTVKHVRRLTQKIGTDRLRIVLVDTGGNDLDIGAGDVEAGANKDQLGVASYPLKDTFQGAGSPANLGAILAGEFGLEGAGDNGAGASDVQLRSGRIPEIDIKVDSIAVTAMTKKLKAKWTPELSQDLNAYHNLDAEVEGLG